MGISLIIFISLAFFGLIDALYIVKHTKKDEPLICPIGFECNDVVNSKYSTFFGVKNDLLGVFFYIGIVSYGIALSLLPEVFSGLINLVKLGTAGAATFSIYLTCIQAFKLKNFCLYCLFSAGFSVGIFVTSLYL